MAGFSARRRFPQIIVLLGLLAGSITVPAAGQWTSIGPDGGWVEVVVIDPVTPSTLYAATDRGGVYKSTDAGASWRLMNPFPPDVGGRIREIQIDPLTPETLYLSTNDGVYKSTNGAQSWMPMNEGLTDTVIGLAIDPSNPSTLYAGTSFRGVFKSTDGADTWTKVLDITTSANVLAVAPSNSSIVYLGAGFSMIFKRTDGGDTWNSVSTGLDNAFVFRQIAVHPTNPDIVYGAADGGLFKTTNGGTSWALLNTPETVIESVVLDPSPALCANNGETLLPG